MTRTNGSCRDSVVWRLRPTLCRSKWRKSERRPVRGLSRFAAEPGPSVGLYGRKIPDHAPTARGGVTGARRKNRHWNGTGVGVCTRERGHRGTAPPNKGGLGMRRWVHWLCRKKGLGKQMCVAFLRKKGRKRHGVASVAWPTDALSRVCRFLARTNELFQKGEAPRTTDVDSLSRPQKREQATKSRTTKSRPPNPVH